MSHFAFPSKNNKVQEGILITQPGSCYLQLRRNCGFVFHKKAARYLNPVSIKISAGNYLFSIIMCLRKLNVNTLRKIP
jgi:hypothetical protein